MSKEKNWYIFLKYIEKTLNNKSSISIMEKGDKT